MLANRVPFASRLSVVVQNLLGQTAINDMQQIAEVVKGAKMLLKNQVLPVGGPEVPWSHPLTGIGDGPHMVRYFKPDKSLKVLSGIRYAVHHPSPY